MADGKKMDLILRALGYSPSFRYEKFRAEWTDGKGQVVVDQTPIGNFCEIEGASALDRCDREETGCEPSGLHHEELRDACFRSGRLRTRSQAKEMTFKAVAAPNNRIGFRDSDAPRSRLDGRGGRPHTLEVDSCAYAPWHFLNFLPEPQGQGSLRPTFS